jgi:hypothetical protein
VSGTARAAILPCGRRLHLQDGPIDLIVEAAGAPAEVARAYAQAARAFAPVLAGLVEELAWLRTPLGQGTPPPVEGAVARRMLAACRPHAPVFITPMAAVAGAVADFVLAAMLAGRTLARASVNNGGDIALYLAPGAAYTVGIVGRLDAPRIEAHARIETASPVRGIATSGCGGRSLSLGIADAVTVLARNAAGADAAATLIANAVDVASPAVRRLPANRVRDDSDLGDRLVVVAVGALAGDEIERALAAGVRAAARMRTAGLIEGAYLSLAGRHRVVGAPVPVLTQGATPSAA